MILTLVVAAVACLWIWHYLGEEEQVSFAWSKAPAWANYAAAGADGVGRWYQNEPVTGFMNEFHPDYWIDYLDGRTQKIPGRFQPGIIEARPL